MKKCWMLLSLLLVACPQMPMQPGAKGYELSGYLLGRSDTVLPYLLLDKGCFSGIKTPGGRVVQDSVELTGVWGDLGSRRPQVNFAKEMVVFVYAGELPTAGFDLQLTGIDETETELVVKGEVLSPVPGRVVAQVVTSPYLVIKLPRSTKEVRWEITGATGLPGSENR